MPRLVAIENIEAGMILASPLANRYGQILMATGTELNPSHARMLKTWGITYIKIESDDDEEIDDEMFQQLKQQAEEKLKRRMNWEPRNEHEKNMFLTALYKHAGKYK